MLIDWFTIIAQAVNFLILVWLLRHFLYKPILDAVAARERKIAAELADADAKRADANREREEFQKRNADLDKQRADLLARATEDANKQRDGLLESAKQAADALAAQRRQALITDAHNLDQAISRRAESEVFAIARKALTDLANTALEERLGDVFTRRLHDLGGDAKSAISNALKSPSGAPVLRSAFEMPPAQRATIQNAINETFSLDVHLQFETSPDLISGIELTSNGQRVAWSIGDYLTTLKRAVDDLITTQAKPEPPPEPTPKPA